MKCKLVRDRVDEVDDQEAIRPVNSRAGRVLALAAKLMEEAAEVAADPSDPEGYADLAEVLGTLMRECGVSSGDVARIMDEKRAKLGGFKECRILYRG